MRRQSREIALQVLFQTEFAPQISFDDLKSIAEEAVPKKEDHTSQVFDYADQLVKGVLNYKSKIDEMIQLASRHWKIDRMAGVDRNILRLAVYEINFAKDIVDAPVVINEAIEIAKVYGAKESAAFVNGILDQVVKNDRR